MSSGFVVEGSMRIDDNDDDDDDDSQSDDEILVNEMKHDEDSIQDSAVVIVDDGEEVLEIFKTDSSSSQRSELKVKPDKPKLDVSQSAVTIETQKQLSLIEAMAASVKQVEGGQGQEDGFGFGKNDVVPENTTKKVEVTESLGAGCAFGIEYKPFTVSKASYQLTSGPAFDDELEFEKDLSKSPPGSQAQTAVKNDDDDDEFSLDETASSLESSSAAIQQALDRARAARETLICLVEDDERKDENQAESADDSQEESEKVDITKMAMAAFKEISDIYSSGLGDQEARTFGMATAGAAGKRSESLKPNRETFTIEEGDEEDEDDEEMVMKTTNSVAPTAKTNTLSKEKSTVGKSEVELVWEAVATGATPSEAIELPAAFIVANGSCVAYDAAEASIRSTDLSAFESTVVVSDHAEKKTSMFGFFSHADITYEGLDIDYRNFRKNIFSIQTSYVIQLLVNLFWPYTRNHCRRSG